MSTRGVIIGAIAAIVLAGGAAAGYQVLYREPAIALRKDIAAKSAGLERYRTAADRLFAVQDRLGTIAKTTLGGRADRVEHRLRAGLAGLAEASGLRGVVVSNGRPDSMVNPIAHARVASSLRKLVRDQADFGVVRARVQGVGSLDAVLHTVAAARAQPWLHRVEGFAIEPVGEERTTFELRLDVATVIVPDLADEGTDAAPIIAEPSEGDLATINELVGRRFLMGPAPKPKPEPKPDPKPAPPENVKTPTPTPPPPFDQWRVAGIVDTGDGPQVVMAKRGGGSRLMTAGESLLGLRFESTHGDEAVFVDGAGVRTAVPLGATLDTRRPIGQQDGSEPEDPAGET